MSLKRAEVIQRMRKAFRTGEKVTPFIWRMKQEGLGYSKTTMLSDWRTVNELEEKAGRYRYVRKDRLPGVKAVAQVTWELEKDWMYVCIVRSQVSPGEPITEQKVNIPQDRPLTPGEVEALAWDMIQEQSPKKIAQVVSVTPWAAVQRIYD